MDEPLPSDLCKICHISLPKYRCPRCSTPTCSLPCTKRHKIWAQCSGIRDPTVYVQRTNLATPSGIDHDYNFLTAIERKIDAAERDAEARGVVLDSGDERDMGWRQRGLHGPVKGEAKLKAALEQSGAIILKAPPGMTRRKQNTTQWNKKKQTVVWTVEWVLNNGRSQIGACAATVPLADLYAEQFEVAVRGPKKRKRSPTLTSSASASPPTIVPSPPPKPSPATNSTSTTLAAKPSLYYYLLRPRTPAPTRVLLPLPSTATLATCLRDRPILEFPTIYVLRYEPRKLPTGFITEETYLAQGRPIRDTGGDADMRGLGLVEQWDGEGAAAVGAGEEGIGGHEGNLDEGRLLEVLQRDLGAPLVT